MTSISSFTLNTKTYSYKDIKAQNFDASKLNAFEQSTLNFANEWLNGKDSFIIHTSGSTGKPKPITILRKQMEASAKMTLNALSLQPGDKALVCLNTAYIAGKMMLVRGFTGNLQMEIVQPSSNPFEITLSQQFDFTALVPLQLQAVLLAGNINKLNHMKAIIIGGAPVNKQLEKEIQNIQAPVYSTYGMTETVSHIALKLLNGPGKQENFTAFDEVEIGTDDRNCLTIKSILTNQKTIATNDIVQLSGKNSFKWLGRFDNIINSGGVKIQTEQVELAVEEVFTTLGLKQRFFITGIPDERLGEKVSLIIEKQALTKEQKTNITNLLKAKLHKYALPTSFYYIKYFEETPTGKISRKATLEKLPGDFNTSANQ
jgi:o-succinylbenzoate---CoA ligase